jgi:hypothetical protein
LKLISACQFKRQTTRYATQSFTPLRIHLGNHLEPKKVLRINPALKGTVA